MSQKRRSRTESQKPKLVSRIWQSASIWTSIAAFVIALMSLWISLRSDAREQEQWMLLNTPRIHIKSVDFLPLRVMSNDSARNTNWGYHALIVPELNEGMPTGRSRLVSRLSIPGEWTSSNLAPLLTRADAAREASRRGVESVRIASEVRFKVVLRNDGVLPIDLTRIELFRGNSRGDSIFRQAHGTVAILGQQEQAVSFNFFLHPFEPVPDSMKFVLRCEFQALGQKVHSKTNLTFIRSRPGWRIDGRNLTEVR
jgi:hypothetical protein